MKRMIAIAGAALVALSAVTGASAQPLAGATTFAGPSQATDPVCIPGFVTTQHLSWILRCRKVVPNNLLAVAVTVAQAEAANCQVNHYWNYGPAVTWSSQPSRGTATVEYVCGHVEG